MMSAAKALGVLLAVAALLFAAPATALLDSASDTVEERGGDALRASDGSAPTPSEADSVQDTPTDTIDQATDPADEATRPVAIADVSVVADEVHHPYLCPAAKNSADDARTCESDRTEDVAVADDTFDVQVTLTNPQDPPEPRTVTVVLHEDGQEVARRTEVMDVRTKTYVYRSYEEACDCYRPSGTFTDVYQAPIVDLDLGEGHVGSTYEVVAYSAPTLGDATDLDATPSDATGPFQAQPASAGAGAGGADAASGAAASGSAQLAAIAVAATAVVATAGAVAHRIR